MKTFTLYDSVGTQIKISDSDYVSEGGEGRIYIKNNLVYKIYIDEKDVIDAHKLKELSVLQRPNILSPKDHVFNDKHMPVGFFMDYATNTIPLPRLFTSSFRNRSQVSPEMSIKLVEKMIDTIQYIHEKDILIVDGNEFNYLVDGNTFVDPYFIDVDSYQTKNFPAKVIMPSIRDWQSKVFSKETDWYSFAIIATQIFIGIHPFKGSHPDFKPGEMKERMLRNISIFNSKSSVPSATRPFNLIPAEYQKWFSEIFESGKRLPPPQIVTKTISKPSVTIMKGSNKFVITKLFEAEEQILGVTFAAGHRIIYTDGSVYLDAHQYSLSSKTAGIVYHNNVPYSVDIVDGMLDIHNFMNKSPANGIRIKADAKLVIDNRVYVLSDNKFSEIKISEMNGKTFFTVGNTWNVMPNSTKIFREVVVQDILGKAYLLVPVRENACHLVAVPELDKCRILDGKYEDNVAVFLVFKDGIYSRIMFKFYSSFAYYEPQVEKDVSVYGINMVSLPNGVYALLDENGALELGSLKATTKNIITGTGIDTNSILCHEGTDVKFALGKEFYSLKMR